MRILPPLSVALSVCALVSSAGEVKTPAPAPQQVFHQVPQKPAELFRENMVWTIHLKFTPRQWSTIEPKRGERPFGRGGFRGGPGGPGGPGGGLAMLLTPSFLKSGDADHDGKLSKDEFNALADHWFTAWDTGKMGKLSLDNLRAGLNANIGMPAFRLQGAPGQRNGLAASMGVEFEYVHADLEFEGQTLKDVGIRYKGNGTWMNSQNSIKKSFKIDTNHFVEGLKFAGLTKINLHNNVTDASFMNEVLSHQLYRDAGVPAPRSTYARVYVTVPGTLDRKYFGLYSIIEDIDKHFERDMLHARHGAIFKPVTPELFADLGDDWDKYKQTYDPKTKLTPAQSRRVIEFSRFLSQADDKEFAARVDDFIDLDEFSRYMSVTVWLSTLDSILTMGQNFYVYLDPQTNKFKFLPWDLDHSFGQFPMGGSQEQREDLSITHPWRGDIRLFERIFKVDAFQTLYLARFDEFNKTIFRPERFHKQVDDLAAAIRPAVKDESAEMLGRFDKVIAGESIPGRGGRGFFGGQGVKPIKGFVDARAAHVIAQRAGKDAGITLEDNRRGPRRGPGDMLAGVFSTALDANRDGSVSREEFSAAFAKWFAAWNTDKSGQLTQEQLSEGINRDLRPPQRQGWFGNRSGNRPEDRRENRPGDRPENRAENGRENRRENRAENRRENPQENRRDNNAPSPHERELPKPQ